MITLIGAFFVLSNLVFAATEAPPVCDSLSALVNPQASRQLTRLFANPEDNSVRLLLQTGYESDGSTGLAVVFEHSAQTLCGDPPEVTGFLPSPMPLACNKKVVLEDGQASMHVKTGLAIAKQTSQLTGRLANDDPKRVAILEQAIKQNGPLCNLLAEWSAMVLRVSVYKPVVIDRNRQELALRLVLSLAANNVYPVNYVGSSSVFLLCARYFSSNGDFATAHVLARYAKYYVMRQTYGTWLDQPSMERIIDDAIAGYEIEIDAMRSNLTVECDSDSPLLN